MSQQIMFNFFHLYSLFSALFSLLRRDTKFGFCFTLYLFLLYKQNIMQIQKPGILY
jgi:hypothetical protein